MRPKAPGLFISKWREEGPVSLEVAEQWRNDFGWEDWMAIIEAALYLDAAELIDLLTPELTPAQKSTYDLSAVECLAIHDLRRPSIKHLKYAARLKLETLPLKDDYEWSEAYSD